MKRFYHLVVLFVFSIGYCYSQQFEEPFPFYVFNMSEAAGLFQHTLPYINAMESGEISSEEDINVLINAAFVREINDHEMTSLFLRAYFREARNLDVQQAVIKHFNNEISSYESNSIEHMYRAQEEEQPDGSIRYNFNNELYDENISFSRLVFVSSEDGRFSSYLPEANWQGLNFSSSANNSLTYMAGGQTTALSVRIESNSYESIPDVFPKDSGTVMYDISELGVNTQNNADRTYIEFIENGETLFVFRLKMFDEDSKTVYSIRYQYNISPININYKISTQMKKHLVYYSFLSYLEE